MQKKLDKKQHEAKAAIERAARKLKALGVTYFISVIDKRPEEPNGGLVLTETSEFDNEDLRLFLTPFAEDREKITALGLHLGNLIHGKLKKR